MRTPIDGTSAAPGATGDDDLAGLVARMADGAESALERFYELTVHRAYALVLRIVRDPHAAEDVVEEAFFQAWRDAARYDPGRGAPLAWLFTICRSRALDHLRRQEAHESYEDPAELEAQIGADDQEPSSLLETMQRSGSVHAALLDLSPQARQLVALAFFRGLSHAEIASACRMPLGTVKTTINRACDRMRDYLGNQIGVAS